MSRFHRTEFDLLPEAAFRPRAGRLRMTLEGKGGGAPAPDPRLTAAQINSMGIQDEAIKGILANQAELQPLQKEQLQQGIDAQKQAMAESAADRQWILSRRGSLSGLQDKMVNDANSFDTEGRREQLAGEAQTDVNNAFAGARGQNARSLAAYGITPGSGRALAMDNELTTSQALASAGAMTNARRQARQEGYSLTDRAQTALAGYPSMGMAATGATAGYGGAGITLANAGAAGMNAGYTSAAQVAGQMGTNATGMFGAQASYKTAADANAAKSTSAGIGALGTVAGAAITVF